MTVGEGAEARVRDEIVTVMSTVRSRTLQLIEPLSRADVHEQIHEFLSPLVWDVGHIGNFEELWAVRNVAGNPPHDPALDQLYNAFENPRWTRGDLPILPLEEAVPYLDAVREEALAILQATDIRGGPLLTQDGYVHRMLCQHESQHQETVLQSLDLREAMAPYPLFRGTGRGPSRSVDDCDRVAVAGGPTVIGTDERGWSYDNERPGHRVDVPSFSIDRFPVTTRRYAAFMADGGYTDARWWSPRGWEWLEETGHDRPQGWLPAGDGGWLVRRLGHVLPLDPSEPVQHVCYFEAEAFAAWAGGRLPTEAEWEKAASWDPATQRKRTFPWGEAPPTEERANVDLRWLGPRPVGSYPAGASAYGVEQMAGDVYEWTSSPFNGYPGFTAFPYEEYSKVFFGGDYRVLRGSSWAIAAPMARATYRNWDHPYRRQIMAGIRVVYDGGR